jgi:SSS family solute:Na+ symporter
MQNLPGKMTHTWTHLHTASANPMGVNVWAMSLGLGFVLSFGYWCTDFLVIQRAMVAKNVFSAQKTPLIAAFPKMLLPFIVILPGLVAFALEKTNSGFLIPLKADLTVNYDMTIPSLLIHFFPSGLLGLGLTALMASFMSGMAGNVTAFNSVFTYDLFPSIQSALHKALNATSRGAPRALEEHQTLFLGRLATFFGILFSIFVAYFAKNFNNIMDLLQLLFGFVNAPLFATFLLGMFWKRTTSNGAFYGLIIGTAAAWLCYATTLAESKGGHLLAKPLIEFQSTMGQAFVVAIVAWVSCFFSTMAISFCSQPKPDAALTGLVFSLTQWPVDRMQRWYQHPTVLGVVILSCLVLLNFWWY